ncbi:hypothetical protein KJ991_01935 [Patescibacteria group bacterium]|nr:hypothetical protein [Patescibacteria group bacterium]MBU4115553.1 hypothetical protein [Patescibacteria group bacterium]
MESSDYKSKIENLRNRLYSRKTRINKIRRNIDLKLKEYDLKSDWGSPSDIFRNGETLNINNMAQVKKTSTLNKVFIIAIIFLLFSILFAYLSFKGGGSNISSDNIEIELSGPASIGAGEVLSLEIDILNKNPVNLETADLLVEYPDGSRFATDIKTTLKRQRESLQTIKSGEKKTTVVKSILFGKEGDKKTIKIGIEYRVPNSNAIFYKEKIYEIEINSSPVSLLISSPKETNSGQEIEFKVDIKSNSENEINDLLLEAEFPFGFKPNKSTPDASFADNLWSLDLKPLEKKTIYIRGTITGQDEEKRTFRFNLGVKKENDEKTIEVNFISYLEQITIKKSFISLNAVINRDSTSSDYVTNAGDTVRVDVSWSNNLNTNVTNGILKVKLIGDILDKASITSINGFYNSADNTISWDKRNNSGFGSIKPGGGGTASFSFKSLSSINNILKKAPEINMEITISGSRLGGGGDASGDIMTTLSRKVVISSNVLLNSRVTYFSGKLINSGPLPPKVGSETTYTVILSVSNSLNDVADGKISMTLPPYVRWMGVSSPSDERISFNPIGGEVEWKIGDLYRGVGYSKEAKEIQFQIAFIPSLSHVGSEQVLVDSITFRGMDTFTDSEIRVDNRQLTTNLKTDQKYKAGDGIIVQ